MRTLWMRTILVGVAVLLGVAWLAAPAWAAITYDTATTSQTEGVTSLTWSHTVTSSGSDRILIVGAQLRNVGGETVTNVKYNNVNLTKVHVFDHTGNRRTEMWYLVNPATGANNVVFNVSSSHAFIGGAMSFTGVDQTTPLGTYAAAQGTSTAPSVNVSSAIGEMVVDAVHAASDAASFTAGANQTERYENVVTTGSGSKGAGSHEDGAATVTMSWSITGGSVDWGIIAVPLKPAATNSAPTAPTTPFIAMTTPLRAGKAIQRA